MKEDRVVECDLGGNCGEEEGSVDMKKLCPFHSRCSLLVGNVLLGLVVWIAQS